MTSLFLLHQDVYTELQLDNLSPFKNLFGLFILCASIYFSSRVHLQMKLGSCPVFLVAHKLGSLIFDLNFFLFTRAILLTVIIHNFIFSYILIPSCEQGDFFSREFLLCWAQSGTKLRCWCPLLSDVECQEKSACFSSSLLP